MRLPLAVLLVALSVTSCTSEARPPKAPAQEVPRVAPGGPEKVAGIFKIVGEAPKCAPRIEGTAFAYAPKRLMTHASIAAGTSSVHVVAEGGKSYPATVVFHDPGLGVAVLKVPELRSVPLELVDRPDEKGAVIAGYPKQADFTVEPATIKFRHQQTFTDGHGGFLATREIFKVETRVVPGMIGGPLLTGDGKVMGVVFAGDAGDPSRGYVLTVKQVTKAASAGKRASRPVSTGACAK